MTETHIAVPTAQRKLTGTEKAAALLLAVGKDNASKVLTYFDEEDIRAIARTASDLGSVSQATLDSIAEEFVSKVMVDGGLRGSSEHVERLLEEIMSPAQVKQIMADVRARMNEAVWPRLVELPAHQLAQFLNKEHPQVITYILSKTSASLSAEVVALFPSHLRNEVMRRLLTNKLVTQQSLRLLEQVLRDELLLKVAKATGQDTHERVAKIVNKLSKKDMDEVLDSLGATRPKAAETVRGLLFTFDDISQTAGEDKSLAVRGHRGGTSCAGAQRRRSCPERFHPVIGPIADAPRDRARPCCSAAHDVRRRSKRRAGKSPTSRSNSPIRAPSAWRSRTKKIRTPRGKF